MLRQLPSLQDAHVVVIGDLMLDRYWHGAAERVSQEAPVPVVAVDRMEARPGGAANVALNVVSLGARCTLIGAVGDDPEGDELLKILAAAGVRLEVERVADYRTVVKLRLVAQRQQLLRADFEGAPPSAAEALLARLQRVLPEASTLVLEDYDKGALADPQRFIELARHAGVPVVVDPKNKSLAAYANADVVKPNEREFQAAVGGWSEEAELISHARALCQRHSLAALVITRGGDGMTLVEHNGEHAHVPAHEVEVFDVTGAGDTAAAALAVARAVAWPLADCVRLANLASGLAVAKLGTSAVSGPELAIAVAAEHGAANGHLTRAQLQHAVTQARAAGLRTVFTNGCFDILHAGHVTYLEEARALGDRLIVAVNDDASVTRLKGEGRPVNRLGRRMRVLAGLAAVDWVVEFAEDTPEALLELLRPEVLVKGGDYGPEEVVGHEIVTGYGGEVRVLSLVEDCSTSAIVASIKGD